MSLNSVEIGRVIRLLSQDAAGGFVQKVRLTSPQRLFLEVRRPGKSLRIFVCTESGRTRLCLSDSREESLKTQLPFQGLLRSRILGAELVSVSQLEGERAVRLEFSARGQKTALLAELTGRHGNLFLLDERDVILGAAVPSSSATRRLVPGNVYGPPETPLPERKDVPEVRFGEALDLEALSQAIEAAYRPLEEAQRRREAREQRLAPLRPRLKKTLRALEAARGDLARTDRADEFRRRGDLIKSAMDRIRRGDREVQVTEYAEDGIRQTVLTLDPALTPQQQAEAAYRQYRRLTGGRTKAAARVAELEAEAGALRQAIERAEREAAVGEGQTEASQTTSGTLREAVPPRRGRPQGQGRQVPFREYRSAAGQRIWTGKSAKLNDALTFGCAKGNDIWMHARGVPGAHVVVPLERHEVMKEETRRDALQLALKFSDLSGGDAGEVSWTQVKYVRRQKKGVPGAVVYSQEKTVLVRPEEARLRRLLSGSGAETERPGSERAGDVPLTLQE